jgi:nitroimidazol reductase NimA-like FMN-containing flavoprotein (pyridoxamine 5'-phosphate oxidase superfamily)
MTGPRIDRPYIPGYGVPSHNKGLLPWSHVDERMSKAQNYWICTVDAAGRPHSTPVWGLWIDGRLYFGGGPDTRRSRNLSSNSAVCVHLESGSDVVIVHGDALKLKAPDKSLTERLADASAAKYGYRPGPEEYESGGLHVVAPRKVLAWSKFPKDATRWVFDKA